MSFLHTIAWLSHCFELRLTDSYSRNSTHFAGSVASRGSGFLLTIISFVLPLSTYVVSGKENC